LNKIIKVYNRFNDKTIFDCNYETIFDLNISVDTTIYNDKSLKEELKLESFVSDEKLVANLYKKYGKSMFSYIDGIFSIIIEDLDKDELIIAQDHSNIKHLFYYFDDKNFVVTNSLNSIFDLKFTKKRLSSIGVSNYFSNWFISQPNTIYEKCYKLIAGSYIVFNTKLKTINQDSFFDIGRCYDTKKLDLSEYEFKEEAKRYLYNSIKKRKAKSKKKIAASLSGGYDSSSIASLLSLESDLYTFTIGFDDDRINEAQEAKKIASIIGTSHSEYYFRDEDALTIVPKLCDIYDEPYFDEGSIPTTLLATLMKDQNIRSVFVGDGGDEVFATADNLDRFSNYLKYPTFIKRYIFENLSKIDLHNIYYIKDHKNIPTKFYKLTKILSSPDIANMVKVKMTLFDPFEINRLVKNNDRTFKISLDDLKFGKNAEVVDEIIGSFFKSFLLDGEIIKTSNAYSSVDIDIREPFMDRELIEFMAKVPQNIKVKNKIKKYLLKEIVYEFIPKEIMDRPKKGFSSPISKWMRGILYDMVMSYVNKERIDNEGILNAEFAIEIRDRFFSGKEEYRYKLWSIFLFELWYEKNFRRA